MRKQTILIILLFLEAGLFGQYPPRNPDYELVFNDEFNYSSESKDDSLDVRWLPVWWWNQGYFIDASGCKFGIIDTNTIGYRTWKWDPRLNKHSFPNIETQDGILKIISKKETQPFLGICWEWPECGYDENGKPKHCLKVSSHYFKYTTGMLISKKKFKYGYFEIRCRLPVPQLIHETRGLGPNFWLWGADSTCATSEIDIFEFASEYGNSKINMYTSNTHYRKFNPEKYPECEAIDTVLFNEASDDVPHGTVNFTDYHTFGADWQPDRIDFYKDGRRIYTSYNHPDELIEMPIIIDINHPSLNFCTTIDPLFTRFPYVYEIDYVRVYQMKPGIKPAIRKIKIHFSRRKHRRIYI